MKFRKGFVSNSSSSSFIICLPRIPTSVDDMKEILFKDQDLIQSSFCGELSTIRIARRVFLDITKSGPIGRDEIIEEFKFASSYDFEDWPEWPEYSSSISNEENRLLWDEYHTKVKIAATKAANIFMENSTDIFFNVRYADDSGDSELEHGDIFRNIKHIRVSLH